MDIRVLRYFLTVAKEQSFTKGAEQLHIPCPSKVLRNTGGKICLYSEDCYRRYLQTR